MIRHKPDISDRFWALVEKVPDGCWIWKGAVNKRRGGYGVFNAFRAPVWAHRMSFELVNGPIPDGLMVCHRCDNPPCVRPDHLFAGTGADNMRDASDKGRLQTGQRKHSKLSVENIREIRKLRAQGNTQREIASKFGVNQSTISDALTGVTWR